MKKLPASMYQEQGALSSSVFAASFQIKALGLFLLPGRGYNNLTTGGRGAMPERYQREIEEILQHVGESTPTKEPRKDEKNSLLTPLFRIGRGIGNHIYLSSGRLMTIGIALLLSAILVSAMFPGFLGPFVWLGLILFILVYALFFARPSFNTERRWRGRPIETQPPAKPEEGLWYRCRRWLRP
jgi:hypothetical protein